MVDGVRNGFWAPGRRGRPRSWVYTAGTVARIDLRLPHHPRSGSPLLRCARYNRSQARAHREMFVINIVSYRVPIRRTTAPGRFTGDQLQARLSMNVSHSGTWGPAPPFRWGGRKLFSRKARRRTSLPSLPLVGVPAEHEFRFPPPEHGARTTLALAGALSLPVHHHRPARLKRLRA